jgi:hypothetical protein
METQRLPEPHAALVADTEGAAKMTTTRLLRMAAGILLLFAIAREGAIKFLIRETNLVSAL